MVFAAYSRPNARLSSDAREKCRTRLGKVAPIMIVAGARASTARTSRRIGSHGVPSIAG